MLVEVVLAEILPLYKSVDVLVLLYFFVEGVDAVLIDFVFLLKVEVDPRNTDVSTDSFDQIVKLALGLQEIASQVECFKRPAIHNDVLNLFKVSDSVVFQIQYLEVVSQQLLGVLDLDTFTYAHVNQMQLL